MLVGAVIAMCFLFKLCRSDYNFATMDTTGLLRHWGYKSERHEVITEDGYILSIFRIPNTNSKYYPVIAQHGLAISSDTWVLCDPKQDLALLLADEGFDVWLLNSRGNIYSKRHTLYHYTEKKFWDFGWHEIGIYDIPATVDYVLQKTGTKQVIHIGHSMGTTSFYVMLSKKPEMNKKIRAHISLAPVVYFGQSKLFNNFGSIVLLVNRSFDQINELIAALHLHDTSKFFNTFKSFCRDKKFEELCFVIMFLSVGPDPDQLNKDCLRRVFGRIPDGVTTKMLRHYLQQSIGGEFREFDYGRSMNLKIYGSSKPHLYNLSRVTAPINLYYASNDYLSNDLDVEKLASALPNVKKKYKILYDNFNHIDYFYAKDVKTLLFDDVIQTMKMLLIE